MTASGIAAAPATALSSEDVLFFHENGYLGPFTLCSPDEMARHREDIEAKVWTTQSTIHGRPTQTRHIDSKVIYDLAADPAIVERVACILGPNVILWQTNFFTKEPGGKPFPWHQDMNYWPLEPMINVSAWLACSRSSKESGCVRIIPGTHKKTIAHVEHNKEDMSGIFRGVEADGTQYDESTAVDFDMQPGEFILFNEKTVHGSYRNDTEQPRIGLAIRMTIPIVRVSDPPKVILVRGEDVMGFNELVDPPTEG